jgi:thiamine biosynthesis lipoprotein
MTSSTFEALGTYVYVATRAPAELDHATRITRSLLDVIDRTCSRFRVDSDLTRANGRAGRWTDVDPLLVAAVGIAVEAARVTGGLVHPLLGRSLVSLGYDRDLAALNDAGPVLPVAAPPLDAWREIGLADGELLVPAGTALDLGATGKAFAADLVVAALADELDQPALVSVGGDLTVSRADGTEWPVCVSEHPGEPGVRIWLESGGLATSSTRVRRWRRDGASYHHLLDPRTGRPADTPWSTATCLGDSAAGANAASTAAIVLGPEAPAWLDSHQVTARLVAATGEVVLVGGWPAEREPA